MINVPHKENSTLAPQSGSIQPLPLGVVQRLAQLCHALPGACCYERDYLHKGVAMFWLAMSDDSLAELTTTRRVQFSSRSRTRPGRAEHRSVRHKVHQSE
jgi:hypothetical protein